MEKVLEYALYFFIYAILGWCVEVIHAALKRGKFENRGFLNGCWCPIYGAGVVLVLLSLTPININVFVLFIASLILTSVLEFIVGFILEKLFKTKWWDYSKEHFNIKGYVCLKYSILWGLACVIVVDLIHPMIANLVRITPDLAKYIICGVLCTVFVVDAIFTVIQLITYKKNYAALEKISDALKKPSNAIFALAIILENTTNASAVILNMIDVFAWVFTWEAVDIFFLQRPKLHKEQQRNTAAIDAEIVFECDK